MTVPRALGLDLGTRYLGVALVEAPNQLLHHTIVQAPRREDLAAHVQAVLPQLEPLLYHWRPGILAIEWWVADSLDVTNEQHCQQLVHLMLLAGACVAPFCKATEHDRTAQVCFPTPAEWKQVVCGNPRANKRRTRRAVETALHTAFARHPGIPNAECHDSDAAGVALWALHHLEHGELGAGSTVPRQALSAPQRAVSPCYCTVRQEMGTPRCEEPREVLAARRDAEGSMR